MSRLKSLVAFPYLHTLLFSAYGVLGLMGGNIDQIPWQHSLRPLAVSLLAAASLILVLRWSGLSEQGQALLASVVVVLFFSYGHVYDLLKTLQPADVILVRHRYLAPLYVLIGGGLFLGIKRIQDLQPLTNVANLVAVVALAFPLFQIGQFFVRSAQASDARRGERANRCMLHADRPERDTYLIILDGYARADILEEIHGFDNSPFLTSLERRGFYVAEGSLSNYVHTEMSLASLLNMNYIQAIEGSYDPASENRMGLVALILDSRVRREFECVGYQTVSFETGYFWTEWDDADVFLEREDSPPLLVNLIGRLSSFELLLLETSAGRLILDGIRRLPAGVTEALDAPRYERYQNSKYVLDSMLDIPKLEGPKFVFAHVVSPHPPFVFDLDGSYVPPNSIGSTESGLSEQEQIDAYTVQVRYLNQRVMEIVDTILDQPGPEPIILIMGDHGWADRVPEDKLSILNAMYLPQVSEERLYPTLTPVNTFRLVFDEFFGTQLGLLEDISYYSANRGVYQFEVVENSWGGEQGQSD